MVQSDKYYKSRAVEVTSEVGLTTDRDLSVLIFDERSTRRTRVAQGHFFRWVQAQDCGRGTPSGSKNASGPVGIPLKRGASGTR